ncbi:MAG: coproporphyrinogen III oxidase family protein [Candidatus Accumulibacter sp.]|jgi:oxygen-independent coproporphyrinogen-3 oxidase|uniref:coproporphyrinogen-III oxidase family protein n=1 Tax=Accumulibacter sp. TaxID=2053492 RepID=UPI001AD227F3|nr:coproporphyrinogen-III oxidase family protein [Accumulibacter sp.]MBN8439528.1 coproporphyrinogen III oxidase family protein [Accumulibacter sp.]
MLIPDIVGMTAKASVNSFDMTQVPHWYMYPPKMSYCDSLHEGVLRAEIEKLSQAVASVYVHIPFCGTKCSFCSLFTSPSQSGSTFSDYTNSLQREIENFSDRLAGGELAVPIVYFGGGTPALLPEAHLAAIVEQIHRHFDTASLRHCSVEFSPEVVDGAMAQRWRKHGFNRASLGIQTFDDAALKAMHRIHSGHDALTAVKRLADAGYGDINVDLIFGYAEQTSAQWYVDLETVLDSDATHCTFHPIAARPKSAFERKAISPDGAGHSTREFHAQAIEFFREAGWRQSSAISYSRTTSSNPLEVAESQGQVTVGFGAGSRSYYAGIHTSTVPYAKRTAFSAVMKHYHECVTRGHLPIMNSALLDEEEQQRRTLILQMHHGSIPGQLVQALGLGDTLTRMEALGLIVAADNGFTLTVEGFVRAAEIGLAFASAAVQSSFGERKE